MEKQFEERKAGATPTPGSEQELSAGRALRHHLFNKLTPILLWSGLVADAEMRQNLQGSCHEMVSVLEELINAYELDGHIGKTK